MPMPTYVPIIDLMLAVPNDDTSNFYDFIRPLLMDEQSRQMFKMPAQYMFKDLPKVGKRDDYIAYTLEKMDEFNLTIFNKFEHQEFHSIVVSDLQMTDTISKVSF